LGSSRARKGEKRLTAEALTEIGIEDIYIDFLPSAVIGITNALFAKAAG